MPSGHFFRGSNGRLFGKNAMASLTSSAFTVVGKGCKAGLVTLDHRRERRSENMLAKWQTDVPAFAGVNPACESFRSRRSSPALL
jgi:hypothetical protein